MVRYFYAWTPFFVLGTVVLLSMPWLGLIALLIVAIVGLIALAALASAIVFVPYTLSRAISRRWHARSSATPRAMAVLPPGNCRTQTLPASTAVLLANPPSERGHVS